MNLLLRRSCHGFLRQPFLFVFLMSAAGALGQMSDEQFQALRARATKEKWPFTIQQNEATKRPLSELCGLVEPVGWQKNARYVQPRLLAGVTLPSSFDWRTQTNGLPPVRDQGQCGCCWAFATIGALECNIQIKDQVTMNLAEQWLVSCNRSGWGCGGGWIAYDYLQVGGLTDSYGGNGAPYDSEFPYTATDATCSGPYPHYYWIQDWAYIGGRYGIPSVDQMKKAILTYGPISVGVAVDNAFQAYSSGIFIGSAAGINHAVVLVGWNDNGGTNGYWILRNSWGSNWGESGYMRIKYGNSKVGYAACYIDYRTSNGQQITPNSVFTTRGPEGGPFTPASQTYTLSNSDTRLINWTIRKTANWITLSSTAGSLVPGASTNVNVCINTNANSLSGDYVDTIIFSNTILGTYRTRRVTLTTKSPPPVPFNPIPANGAVSVATDANLSWNHAESDLDAALVAYYPFPSSAHSEFFPGNMDEAIIYSCPLSPNEIGRLYEQDSTLIGDTALVFSMQETADDEYNLYSMRPDPAQPNLQPLPMNDSGNHCYPVVSPDGRFVLYCDRITASSIYQLWVLDRSTGEKRFLLDGHPEDWHPSGQRFLYISGEFCSEAIHEAFVSETSTGLVITSTRILFDSSNPTGSLGAQYSPDGRSIAFSYCPDYCSYENMEIYVASLEESLPVPKTNLLRLTANSSRDYEPHWTPDGQQIIWGRSIGQNLELWRKNADGTGSEQSLATLSNAANGYGAISTPPIGYTGAYAAAVYHQDLKNIVLLRQDGGQDRLDMGPNNDVDGFDWINTMCPSSTCYDVYFGTESPPADRISQSILRTDCDPGTLAMGTRYYWQVVASNEVAVITGAVWTFETESLQVSPERGLNSGGHSGGPFSPSNAVYTVSNVGTGRIAWTASSAQKWMTVTPPSGTLETGEDATVTVAFHSEAEALSEGIYSNTVIFSNANTTITQTRPVTLTVFTFAPTIFVDAGNTNRIEDGTADHPYQTIGRGVATATAGSTIQVAAGTYTEQVCLRGKYGIRLVGGEASTIVTNAGYKFLVESSSEITIQGFHVNGGSNGFHIVNSSGVALISNVIELVSQGNYAYGGAIIGSGSCLRLSGNTIQNCYGGQMGGAGYFINCSLEISNNNFLNDTAWNSAGGIYVWSESVGHSVKMFRNLFSNCHADYSGAIDIRGSRMDEIEIFNNTLTHCDTILDVFNGSGTIRLGVHSAGASAKIVNNVIHDLKGSYMSRVGVYVRSTAPTYVANNIFNGPGGYCVYGDIGSHVTAEYNCYNGNRYSGVTEGPGTITKNPRFVNPDTGDFRLLTNSACIDTGNPDASYNDLDGTRNDMGVFGGAWGGGANGGVAPRTTNTIYVNEGNTNGLEDGTAAHPYRTIGQGVTNAAAGSIVQVAAGTYDEQMTLCGKYDISLIGAGASTIVTNSGYKFRIDSSSAISIRGFNLIGNDSGTLVNSSDEITIQGLTVIGGRAGIIVNSSDVELVSNVIENVSQNRFGYGGAVIGSGSSLRLNGNTIQNCYGGQMGGAGYFVNCSLEISGNDFLNDTAWNSAGGLYVQNDSSGHIAKMFRNRFSNCHADRSGAIDIRGSQIDQLEIFNNILTRCGSDCGLSCSIRLDVSGAASTTHVINNVIHDFNLSCWGAPPVGVYVKGAAPACVANNIFSGSGGYSVYGESGNHATAEYNCINGNVYGGVIAGPGTITVNPMFVNPDTGDFRLLTGSACVDAGNPDASYNDPDGTRNDMGNFGGLWSSVKNGGVIPTTENTIYVNAGNTDGIEDGTVAHPYRTIGQGITNAVAGSIIQVAEGVYAEQLRLCGKYNITLIGAGASTIVTNPGYKFQVESSSRISIRGFKVIGGRAGIIVNSSDVELVSNVIENVSQNRFGYGGAVIGSGSSLRLNGNTIQNCYGGQMGGAGYFVNCSLEISGNDFLNDTAWNSAGGLYVQNDSSGHIAKMFRNRFSNCHADHSGAIDIRGSRIDLIEIFNNILTHCGADHKWAGAIHLDVNSASSTAQIVNNVIYDAIGGFDVPPIGVYVNCAAPVYVANNIFSEFNGYSVYGESGSHVTVEYNCNNGNGCCGVSAGPGTITSNPMFLNPGAGNFRLQMNSACINAGNPDASYNDLDGTRSDMGAFGGNYTSPRRVRVVNATGSAGGTVIVPVKMAAIGDESSLSFSMTYDPMALSNPRVTLGASATNATLAVNTQQAGRMGVWLYLKGQMFAAGDLDLVRVAFLIAPSAPAGATPIGFTNAPAQESASNAEGISLFPTWTDGSVNIIGNGDSDGDGMSDGAEDIAGTDPGDSNSCFKIKFPASGSYATNSNGVFMQWFSASNRVYHLYRSTNLSMSNNGFYSIAPTDIQTTPTLITYTDTTATGIGPYFYKVGIEKKQ